MGSEEAAPEQISEVAAAASEPPASPVKESLVAMALTSAEKQQVEEAVDAFLESPNVQTGITDVVKSVETAGVKAVDAIIANAKAGGLLGGLLNALKGSAEAEVNALVASLPPAAIAQLATKGLEDELKTILGA